MKLKCDFRDGTGKVVQLTEPIFGYYQNVKGERLKYIAIYPDGTVIKCANNADNNDAIGMIVKKYYKNIYLDLSFLIRISGDDFAKYAHQTLGRISSLV